MQKYAVVYFPQLDSNRIDIFRKKYDPKWNIIPPHITLVSPISGLAEDVIMDHLETIIQELHSFPITFSGLVKSFDHFLFLQVRVGSEEVIAVHHRLYSGRLSSYFPVHFSFAPHITLGYFGNKGNGFNRILFASAYREAESMHINFSTIFNSISLIKGDGLHPARILKTFTLHS